MKHKIFAVRGMLAWLLLAACVILAAGAVLSGMGCRESKTYPAGGKTAQVQPIAVKTGDIPVNTADAETLQQLPGVGAATAEDILAEREMNGPFFYPEDLMQVDGIGEKKLDGMRDMLDLTEE